MTVRDWSEAHFRTGGCASARAGRPAAGRGCGPGDVGQLVGPSVPAMVPGEARRPSTSGCGRSPWRSSGARSGSWSLQCCWACASPSSTGCVPWPMQACTVGGRRGGSCRPSGRGRRPGRGGTGVRHAAALRRGQRRRSTSPTPSAWRWLEPCHWRWWPSGGGGCSGRPTPRRTPSVRSSQRRTRWAGGRLTPSLPAPGDPVGSAGRAAVVGTRPDTAVDGVLGADPSKVERIEPVSRDQAIDPLSSDGSTSNGYDDYFRRR